MQNYRQIILAIALSAGFEIGRLAEVHAVHAQTSRLDTIRIVERGAYSADASLMPDARSPTGAVNTFKNIRLLSSTTSILGKVGTSFGLQYALEGTPRGASVELKIVVIFPRQGLRRPDRRAALQQTDFVVRSEIGAVAYSGYQFDHDWEVVPGTWTFEIWRESRLLVEQRFCVYTLGGHSPAPSDRSLGCEAKLSSEKRFLR